jgi:hypothetical protein
MNQSAKGRAMTLGTDARGTDPASLKTRPPRPNNWFSRNWPWAVPVGCLAAAAALFGFAALILSFVFGIFKSSDPYQQALVRARTHPAVVRALGEPIKEGFFASGNMHVSGPSGEAELAIPISGPKGKATIYVEATQSVGQWSFTHLVVEIDGTRQRIDLLDEDDN